MLTDVRLLGPRLAEPTAGPDARIVPLHLADTALLDLIRPGDVVDVLAAAIRGTGGASTRSRSVVATDAVVVLVSEKPTGAGSGGDRVVLVALPAHAANDVAGASLVQTVTLTPDSGPSSRLTRCSVDVGHSQRRPSASTFAWRGSRVEPDAAPATAQQPGMPSLLPGAQPIAPGASTVSARCRSSD